MKPNTHTGSAAERNGPTGRPILFRTNRDLDTEVYAVNPDGPGLTNLTNADGTGVTRLTNDLHQDFLPDW